MGRVDAVRGACYACLVVSAARPTPAERFRIALDLADLGQRLYAQQLRRKNPRESEAQIMLRMQRWMRTRPGAEHGDGVGRPIEWPRPGK